MKKWFGFLAVGLLLAAGASKARAFEGEVDYQYTRTNGDTMTMVDFIKGDKVMAKMQMKGHESQMIMDFGKRKMWMLLPQQKMAMPMDFPDSKKIQSSVKGKFHKTGKTQTILGFKCEEWIYESNYGKSSIWTASGFGVFPGMGGAQSGDAQEWINAVKSKKMFALKIVTTDKDGKDMGTMEATKVEKKSVSSSLFTVPSDYKVVKTPDLGAAMGDSVKPKLPF